MAEPRALLANHSLFRTADLDEAREAVARVFCPHRLALEDRDHGLRAVHNSARLGRVTLNYLDYGAAVHIEPGELGSFFLVQIPVAGRSLIRCGPQEIVSTPALASVPAPTEHLDMHWDAGDPQLIVKVERPVLEHALQQMLGHALSRPIRFDLGMDLTSAAGRSWLALVRLLVSEAEQGDGLAQQPLAVAHVEDALLTSLLLAQPHNYSAQLHEAQRPIPPKVVRRAMELIESKAELSLTTEDIARAACVSVRTLQEAFQKYVGCSPMAYLRDVRLQRVHDELRASDSGHCTVTDVALNWGFFHHGRFTAAYRAKFGEPPSQTLRGR